ncbi:ATP phosphoribosyltransferase [Phycisphaerae bacterium]|jgi:ATP phosphoribosyltransferase|nr:ATP phosphoribosyltransferase [Phycisphaerae bacterium]
MTTFASNPKTSFSRVPRSLSAESTTLRLAIPNGPRQAAVIELLSQAGLRPAEGLTPQRPLLPLPNSDCKALSPQNIIGMLATGSRDLGFAGSDWVEEQGVDLVELVDTGLDPVSIVAAAPTDLLDAGRLPQRELIVASEYEKLARAWIASRDQRARFVRTYGDTQAFTPEDADVIIDAVAWRSPQPGPGLTIIEDIMRTSTKLFASRQAMSDPDKRRRIEDFAMLVRSVLAARERVMIDLNVSATNFSAVIESLPCMREPTVAPLNGGMGFAVRVAVPRVNLAQLIPIIKARGGTDIVVTQPSQIVI